MLNKLITYCILFLLSSTTLFAFQTIQKDTSYTVISSYKKYIKNFPQIEIVKPQQFQNITEIENITYKKLNARELKLDAFINTSENNPAVILVHGGGWKSGDKSHMKPMAQYIASKGYSCFAIEYRLSDEAQYPEGIFDIKQAIQFIKANALKFHVDTTKVAVLGTSSGAQMASLVGTTNNNSKFEEKTGYKTSTEVQAIINLDGILAFKHPKSKEGKMASWWLDGTYEEKPEIWKAASALTHIDENTPPTLFISSQNERFQAGREEMIEIMEKYQIYYQVENFPDSPHTFWLFNPWFKDTVNYITTFLDKTFKKNHK
ncbi:alpha/beta hydrolase [Winogradskyella echinorum]|uniref:Alpha/beta hydrolase n=1 Tax=Winogradskyella echinorum TaxID=538189 RepID=A0ABR6XYC7_9FLAO|nr:alpha/beta hydrolase [Winogradskyella echinorum]MBC3845015.1 alpha/beta hydrolase [Winogradskyella echinorum]MBC5749363.1 alpha/beta hydrolase [Winogradskyella echinorum]